VEGPIVGVYGIGIMFLVLFSSGFLPPSPWLSSGSRVTYVVSSTRRST